MTLTRNRKVIVAGTRRFNNYFILCRTLMKELNPTDELVSGLAKGPDIMAVWYGEWNNHEVHHFPADWEGYGTAAGVIRNSEMQKFAKDNCSNPKLIAFWDGESRGTKHMIDVSTKAGFEVKVIRFGEDDRIVFAPNVVHCKRDKYDVYIGRGEGSVFYNPYPLNEGDDRYKVICHYINDLCHDQQMLNKVIVELRGKTLGCWCHYPGKEKYCHGDFLTWIAHNVHPSEDPKFEQYRQRLKIPITGDDTSVFKTSTGLPLNKGYKRIVIGLRGPYIECTEAQMNHDNIHEAKDQLWRHHNDNVYYYYYNSNDMKTKIYLQTKPVDYADYVPGLYYLDPFKLTFNNEPIIERKIDVKNQT